MNTNLEIYETEGVYGDSSINHDQRLNQMLELIKGTNIKSGAILDIGCGTGFFTSQLRNVFPEVKLYGVDISETALKIGKEKYPFVFFAKADAERSLPFVENTFDIIISGEHIEHLKDVDTYLLEVSRVMKENGVLVLSTPNLGFWLSRLLLLFGRQPFYLEPSLRKSLPIISYFGKTFPENLEVLPSGHLRLYTLNMLKKLLAHYGFEVIEVKSVPHLKGKILRTIDNFFARFPSLGYGLIIKAQKYE